MCFVKKTISGRVFVPVLLVVLVGLSVFFVRLLPDKSESRFVSRTKSIMATPITVVGEESPIDQTSTTVFEIFQQVDQRMSEWKPDSPLTEVNQQAGVAPVKVPVDLLAVIQQGIELGDLTDGAFDITWAALWGLWDFTPPHTTPPHNPPTQSPHTQTSAFQFPVVPDQVEIASRASLVDYRKIVIDQEAGTVFLPEGGMMIGLGGIAKGYALDQAAEALVRQGVEHFLISAGGQVIVSGQRGDRPWSVGIRDPRGAPEDYFARLPMTGGSISTSGDYERFFIHEGIRYHHILDPRTGMPARAGLRSVTVIHDSAVMADVLSTVLMIMGKTQGMALVDRIDGAEAVLVDDQGQIHISAGLTDVLIIIHQPRG